MSNIESLTLWNDGVVLMEKKDYQNAITAFLKVPETSSKTLFNTAVCHIILGGHRQALQAAEKALGKDEYLAVGYYLKGIINFNLNRLDDAAADFAQAHTNLRGRKVIDYNQLGLKYKLYDYEPLYNGGVVWSHLRNRPKALDCLLQAQKSQNDIKRLNIDQIIASVDRGQKVQLLQMPYAEMIFRPPKTKMSNLQKKDYLGKAKVISALDNNDKSPGFEAPRKMSLGLLQVEQMPVKLKSAPSSPTHNDKDKMRRPSIDSAVSTDTKTQLEKAIGEAAGRLKATGIKLPSQGMKTSKSDSNLVGQDAATRRNIPPPPNKPAPKLPSRSAVNGGSGSSPPPPRKPLPLLVVGGDPPPPPPPSINRAPIVPSKYGADPPPPNKPPPSLPGKANIITPPSKPPPSMPGKSNVTTPPPNKSPPSLPSRSGVTPPPNKPAPQLPSKTSNPPPSKPAPSPSSGGRQPLPSPPRRDGQASQQKVGKKDFNLNQKRSKPLPQLPAHEKGDTDNGNAEDDLYLYAEETNQLAARIEMLRELDRSRQGPVGEEYTAANCPEESRVSSSQLTGSTDERCGQRKPLPAPARTPVINAPATTIPYNKPPKPPYSAKTMVSVEINCNGSKMLKFRKGTSLEKLLCTACEEFVLEQGTADLWYKRSSDEEFICIEDESEMSGLWQDVKDKLTLWCFSKD